MKIVDEISFIHLLKYTSNLLGDWESSSWHSNAFTGPKDQQDGGVSGIGQT